MTNNEQKSAPGPTLRRLATYHHYLKRLQEIDRQVVSCTHIADELKLDSTQVRKDIEITGIVGKARVGYDVDLLVDAIREFLGWNNTSDAFLAGVGSMGSALLGYDGFKTYGLHLVAAFDIDPAKIGREIYGKEIFPLDKLPTLAQRMGIPIGIITVPADQAQKVADLMVQGGIRAIWNFAPAPLDLPENIILENVLLSSSFAVLSNRLNQLIKSES